MHKMIRVFVGTAIATAGLMATVAAGQKPGTTAGVALSVTIEPLDSALGATHIGSDGLGPYIDGQDGVAAHLDQYGNIIVNFQTTRSALRQVAFDFSEPRSAQNNVPPSGAHSGAYLSSVPQSSATKVAIHAMPVGSEQCIQLAWSFTVNQPVKTQWRVGYRRSGIVPVLDASYAVVERVDADTWSVEPRAAACNAGNSPGVANVVDTPTKGTFTFTDDGTYFMPFRLTLRRN